MTWQPGQPVVSEQDRKEWAQWRKDRKREQQRRRRAENPRIDFYPDAGAWGLICTLTGPHFGEDYSSIINRIVDEWANNCHRNKQRLEIGD